MLLIKNTLGLLKLSYYLLKSGVLFNTTKILLTNQENHDKKKQLLTNLGEKLALLLPKIGPAFVKLGQTLSTRSDLLGENLSSSLSKLQDKIPPCKFKHVKFNIEKQLKSKIEELFIEFDKNSCAAASIAQVHKAKTKNGKIVAVKVLRPKIRQKFSENLNLMMLTSQVLTFFLSDARRLKLIEVTKTVRKGVEMELDLRLEAAAADKLRINSENDTGIYIPKVLWEYTSSNILTTEWIDGIPIYNKKRLLEKGHDMYQLAKKLAVIFFNQAYRDGFFHADIHPGNIFVMDNGDIALVDFGIIGYLDYTTKVFMAKILYGFLNKDYESVAKIHFKAGLIPQGQSKELFELACRSIGEPIIGKPVEKISISQLLKQLFETSRTFSMEIQPQLLLLHKTIITLEGTGYFIYPKVNMWHLAKPWIKKWARRNLGKIGQLKSIKYDTEKFLGMAINTLEEFINKTDSLSQTNLLPKDNIKKNNYFLRYFIVLTIILFIGIIIGKNFS